LTDQQKATTEIIALSSDDPMDLQLMVDRVAEENDGLVLDYTLLTDPDASVINRYGLFNQDDPRGRAIPHPTTYVIDMDGVIRWKMTEVNYRIRPENDDIVRELTALDMGR
jgi:peroxiredoxin